MPSSKPVNLPLFNIPQFPSTRYQGSKKKLVRWIWQQISDLQFQTCLDAFGGTGVVAHYLKQMGKQVTYNDILKFNYLSGMALIENKSVHLLDEDMAWLLEPHPHITYPTVVADNFHNIYFTDAENDWLDQTITNIFHLDDIYLQSIAFFALSQAAIIKRPYNLFHRKNLYVRTADVKRTFGNKTTWDTPFEKWFRVFVQEANAAVFDNGHTNGATCKDATEIAPQFDLVYIDPPYISGKGVGTDYHGFYHFLEGLANYEEWEENIDMTSKHRRLKRKPSMWTDRKQIHTAFDQTFSHFKNSILIVSYRSDGIPSIDDLLKIMKQYKQDVQVHSYGQYQYALSKNVTSKEVLIIGK